MAVMAVVGAMVGSDYRRNIFLRELITLSESQLAQIQVKSTCEEPAPNPKPTRDCRVVIATSQGVLGISTLS
jgi:hypothetical protein